MPDGTGRTDKALDVIVLVLGIIVLFAAFLPVSYYSEYYETISYLGGITYLLYVIPFFAIGTAAAALYGKLPKARIWYAAVGGIGFVLSFLTGSIGSNTLKAFVEFNSNVKDITPRVGLGALLLFLGYFVIAFAGYISVKTEEKEKAVQSEEEDDA